MRRAFEYGPRICALGLTLLLGGIAGGCVSTPEIPDALSDPSALARAFTGEDAGATQGSRPLTASERRMREQGRAFDRTVWEGVLIGAGAGTVWGLINRDDASDVAKKALIGAAVGGLTGAYIAHVQKKYATQEDQLDAMTTDVRQSNRETDALIASAREVIAEDRRRLASAQRRYGAGQITESELTAARQRAEENKAVIDRAVTGAREQYSMFEGAEREFRRSNPTTDTGELQRELDAYNSQIDTLDGLADSIAVA
jgi:hypothetical protein